MEPNEKPSPKEPPKLGGKQLPKNPPPGPEHRPTKRMIHEQLPAVITKIARMLAVKPEYFVTHPSELKIVQALSDSELRDLAQKHCWRFVRRVGGRQVEFYNDAGMAYRPL